MLQTSTQSVESVTKAQRRNDEIRMTKLEGMRNDQMMQRCHWFSGHFELRACLVIRHLAGNAICLDNSILTFGEFASSGSQTIVLTACRADADHRQFPPVNSECI